MFETSGSYILQDAPPESSNDQDEVDSLPSSIVSSDLESEEESDAQKEWEASLQQLELLLTMVVVPYIGKYFGRKCAFWSRSSIAFVRVSLVNYCGFLGWAKYMEWMYPVEVRYTSKTTFKTTGAVVAATL